MYQLILYNKKVILDNAGDLQLYAALTFGYIRMHSSGLHVPASTSAFLPQHFSNAIISKELLFFFQMKKHRHAPLHIHSDQAVLIFT